MMRKTWHCRVLGMHLVSQNDIERLKRDDPCWSGDVWFTYEPAVEPVIQGSLDIRVLREDTLPKPDCRNIEAD